MAASEECIAKIADAGKITTAQAMRLLFEVADRAEKMRASGEKDPFVSAAAELSGKVKEAARADRLDALRNTAKRNAVMDQVTQHGGIKNAYEALAGILGGSNKLRISGIESAWKGLSAGWQSGLDNALKKIGLQKAMISGQMDKDVSVAWWRINAGESAGSGPAAQVAKLYGKAMDTVRERLNAQGARIADASDYVTKTSHDPTAMRQAAGPAKTPDEAFAAWWSKTEPRLAEKTFADLIVEPGESAPEARVRFGRSVFDSLVSGVHMKFGGADEGGYTPPAFEGSFNIARKISQERTLFWKDGESWHDHMQDFGQFPSLHASVMMSLDQGARQLALMDKLGTNPAANLSLLTRRIQETYRSDIDGVAKFSNKIQGLKNIMGRLDGSLNIPASMGLAKGANAIRTWESISSLGGVGVTHFASIWPTVTSELGHHGVGTGEAIGGLVRSLVGGKGDAERQAIMADLGAYADGVTRHISNVMGDDSIPGRISNIASRFMDFTGIHYIFDQTKAGVRDMLAHNLARNLTENFGDLDKHLSQMLTKYGIGEPEWQQLQKTQDLPTWQGRQYLTPSAAGSVDPVLQDKLLSYYGDGAGHSVVTAGVRERAFLLGSTRPGTGWGETARFLTQFKMWPVAAMNQVIGREIYMSLSKSEGAWNLGKLVALGIPAGYLRMTLNDLATGHPPRDPADPKTLFAALAQSGGLGIFGDFLFGEASRMGGGLIATAGGPVVSDADALVKIFNQWKQGEASWPDLAHFAVRHVPFANLVYLKGALDYLLWYHLYEAASPGWWERTNRRMQKENGRTMVGYAPGQGVPWNPVQPTLAALSPQQAASR